MIQIPTSLRKKFVTLAFSLMFVSGMYAQGLRPSAPSELFRSTEGRFRMSAIEEVGDTLVPPGLASSCGDTVTVYLPSGTGAWGYISGNNQYGDKQKAQKFTYASFANTLISEVWVFFAEAKGPGNSAVKVNVYSATTGGAPATLLGSSSTLTKSQLQLSPTSLVPTIFPFTQSPTLTGADFFLSVDLSAAYAAADTIGIFSTRNNCGTDAWEQFSDDTWFAMNDGTNSWGLNLNLDILGIVKVTTGVDASMGWEGIALGSIQLNGHTATLSYDQSTAEPVEMAMYSINGERISKWTEQPGAAQSSYDHGPLPAGVYIWTIANSRGQIGLKWIKP